MDFMNSYKGNALDITDVEVASDWRLGLIRALARILQVSTNIIESHGPYGTMLPNSMMAHMKHCTFNDIRDIREDIDDYWEFDTFSDDTTKVTVLHAKVSCACGTVNKMDSSMIVHAGELVTMVANQD